MEKEISKEINDVVEEVCEKFGYDSNDKENSDSLKTVLLKVVTVMLKDSKQEDRKLFYQMLRHTPIVITEKLTREEHEKLVAQYIGDINPHITKEDEDIGEYGKDVAPSAYFSEPVLDENLQLKGKKSFVYVQKVSEEKKDFFGTDINVAHLIHELGHAWNAEKDEYIMQDNNILKDRIGTAEFTYSFHKGENNRYVRSCDKVAGLMIEEGMNTIKEEQAMAAYMNIPLEEMQEKYRTVLTPSNYQGYISNFIQYTLDELNSEDFENWRLYGSPKSKEKIEALMSRTKYWEDREQDILSSSDSPRNYDKKRMIISRSSSDYVQDFFRQYEDIYFPDISKMTPLDKIENVLEQFFNMNTIKYSIDIKDYQDLLDSLGYEGYSLINQTAEIKKKDELLSVIDDVRLSDLNLITEETKSTLLKSSDRETEDKEVKDIE